MAKPHLRRVFQLRACALLAALALAPGCGDDDTRDDDAISTRDAAAPGDRPPPTFMPPGGSVSTGGGSGPDTRDAAVADAGGGSGGACDLPDRAVDVIFVIDTSGSMVQEIVAIQQNINQNFADILDEEGVDYRVILIGTHGFSDETGLRICISEPLSGGTCAPVPDKPVNTERFRHYSSEIFSLDSLCQILDTFEQPDEFGLAPTGWSSWLRAGALKVFVEVTDDGVACASMETGALFPGGDDPELVAASFDEELRTLSPRQFESDGMRNYKWYSMIGVARSAGPSEELIFETCATAPTPGLPYQSLSVLTGSMRYPVCEGTSFPVAFQAIADEVVDEALPCQDL